MAEDWDLEAPERQQTVTRRTFGLFPSDQITLRGTLISSLRPENIRTAWRRRHWPGAWPERSISGRD